MSIQKTKWKTKPIPVKKRSAHLSEYVDRAFRFPIFLSTTNSLK